MAGFGKYMSWLSPCSAFYSVAANLRLSFSSPTVPRMGLKRQLDI